MRRGDGKSEGEDAEILRAEATIALCTPHPSDRARTLAGGETLLLSLRVRAARLLQVGVSVRARATARPGWRSEMSSSSTGSC